MKRFKKVLVSVMTFVMMMSMISVYATGDGSESQSQYPGADSYSNGFSLPGNLPQNNMTVGEYITKTPAQHLFYVDGTPFILLDTDSEGNYFVMCEYTNGNNSVEWPSAVGDVEDTYEARKFNPDNTKNIAYKINYNIKKYVPSSDMRNQIKITTWNFAPDVNNPDAVHTATCKLAVPSVEEFKTYFNKIGFTTDNLFPGTPSGVIARDLAYRAKATKNQYYPMKLGRYSKYAIFTYINENNDMIGAVRPVFFLDKDFFKTVRCDVSTLGEDAKAEVRKCSLNDLIKTYPKEDLIELGFNEDDVKNIVADRILISGYPTADSYNAPYYDTSTIGNIGTAETVTPAANILKIGNKEYVYLDVDKDGNMFVMAKNCIFNNPGFQGYTSDATGDERLYNAANSKSMAYKIDNDYFTNAIPDVTLQEYVLDYDWYTETNRETPYSTKAKLAAPSATEIVKYYSKLGEWYAPFNMRNGYVRTPSYTNGDINGYMTIWVNSTELNGAGGYNMGFNNKQTIAYPYIRPVFFIDKNYFLDNVLGDIESQGENVKQFMRASFTKEELRKQGYTESDLIALGYAGKPSASDVKATGDAYAKGQTLYAEYTFVPDADSQLPEKSSDVQYQWYRADTANGTYSAISGATSAAYTLTDDDIGKYIKVGVKTANYDETADEYALSNATAKIAEKVDLIFRSAGLYDGSGNAVTNINGETSLEVKLNIKNTTDGPLEKYAILAIYGNDNVLKAVKTEKITISAGESDYSVSLDGFTAGEGWSARAMVWDNMVSLRPQFGKKF